MNKGPSIKLKQKFVKIADTITHQIFDAIKTNDTSGFRKKYETWLDPMLQSGLTLAGLNSNYFTYNKEGYNFATWAAHHNRKRIIGIIQKVADKNGNERAIKLHHKDAQKRTPLGICLEKNHKTLARKIDGYLNPPEENKPSLAEINEYLDKPAPKTA